MNCFIIAILGCIATASAAPSLYAGGWGGASALLVAPRAAVTISKPYLLAPQAIAAPLPLSFSAPIVAPIAIPSPVASGVAAITAGGGSIDATVAGAAIRGPPTAPVVISGPSGSIAADSLWGPTSNIGGSGALGSAPVAPAVLAAPANIVQAAPIAASVAVPVSSGVAAITNGGGSIAATGAGAAIRGPPTAPVVVSGPSGSIAADGLWGPTSNIGGLGALGAAERIW